MKLYLESIDFDFLFEEKKVRKGVTIESIKKQIDGYERKAGRRPKNIEIIDSLSNMVDPIIYAAQIIATKKKNYTVEQIVEMIKKSIDLIDIDNTDLKKINSMSDEEKIKVGKKIAEYVISPPKGSSFTLPNDTNTISKKLVHNLDLDKLEKAIIESIELLKENKYDIKVKNDNYELTSDFINKLLKDTDFNGIYRHFISLSFILK